ncbi:MAG: hypothetical protein HYT22_01915 [Candidatus Niyogibacteria bacterium]|nr:hypothetical protein [Candidatus Niyogibacteria bacterium]
MRPRIERRKFVYHGKVDDLIYIFEKLGIGVEWIGDAEKRLKIRLTEGDVHILEHQRMHALESMVRDANFLVYLVQKARAHPERVKILLVILADDGERAYARPESMPMPLRRGGKRFSWEAVIVS